MRYQPTDLPERTHIGEKWSKYQLRSMQIILQATHGVVSGKPDFFKRAFGDTYQDYEDLLIRPHHYLFNREYYENYDHLGRLSEYLQQFKKLKPTDKNQLLEILSSSTPQGWYEASKKIKTKKIYNIFQHYLPLDKEDEAHIWEQMKNKRYQPGVSDDVPDDERVEDADLVTA